MKSTHRKTAITLMVAGACILATSQLVANWHNWEPVIFPIDLRVGQTASPQFRVDRSANYLIELEVERALPFQQLNCLLGVDMGMSDYCNDIQSPVSLKWFITSSNKIVARGDSSNEHDGAWGAAIRRTIGHFRGEKTEEYRLTVQSLTDASVLMPAAPKISVRAHPLEAKSYIVAAQAIFMLGAVVGLIGLVLLVRSLLIRAPVTTKPT